MIMAQTLFAIGKNGKGDGGRSVNKNDVIQGGASDCSIMASIKALALDNPSAIKNMITSKKDGTYDVKLYQNGKPVIVNVSAKDLPLMQADGKSGGALLSGDTVNNKQEIWPNVIEKAVFKLQGGRTDSYGKPMAEYLEMVTGAKVNSQVPSGLTTQQIGNSIKGALDVGNPVVAATPTGFGSKGTFGTSVGTVYSNHAYTVTSVDLKKGTLTLHNPWGKQDLVNLPISEFKQVFAGFSTGLIHKQSNLQASNPEAQKIVAAGYGKSSNKVENPNTQQVSGNSTQQTSNEIYNSLRSNLQDSNPNAQQNTDNSTKQIIGNVQNIDNSAQQISDKIYNSLLRQGKNRVEITAYLLENFSVDLATEILKRSDPIIKSLSTELEKSSEAEQLIKSAQNSADKQPLFGKQSQTPQQYTPIG
jgi:hypothetical protein